MGDVSFRYQYQLWCPYTTRKCSHFEPQVIEVPAITIMGECFFVVSVYYKTAREITFWFPNALKKKMSHLTRMFTIPKISLHLGHLIICKCCQKKEVTLTSMYNVNKHIHHQQSTLQFFQRISWQLPGFKKTSIPVKPVHQVPQTQRCTMLGLKFTWSASHPLQASTVFFGSATSKYLNFCGRCHTVDGWNPANQLRYR